MSLEDPNFWKELGIAGLAMFLIYRLASGKMDSVVVEMRALNESIKRLIEKHIS